MDGIEKIPDFVHKELKNLDSGFRRNDDRIGFLTFCDFVHVCDTWLKKNPSPSGVGNGFFAVHRV
jgi:hypothetical protein